MSNASRQFLSIVGGTIGLACGLGVCIDLVTANMAVEYFSVHHPKIISSEHPLALALAWGIAASWWFGAIAGLIAAFINYRRAEPLPTRRILKWVAYACVCIWTIMMLIVVATMLLSSYIPIEKRRATFESDRRIIAVAMAHQYEYLFGAIAVIVIAVMIWRTARPSGPIQRSG